jgi:hypothetical protein
MAGGSATAPVKPKGSLGFFNSGNLLTRPRRDIHILQGESFNRDFSIDRLIDRYLASAQPQENEVR